EGFHLGSPIGLIRGAEASRSVQSTQASVYLIESNRSSALTICLWTVAAYGFVIGQPYEQGPVRLRIEVSAERNANQLYGAYAFQRYAGEAFGRAKNQREERSHGETNHAKIFSYDYSVSAGNNGDSTRGETRGQLSWDVEHESHLSRLSLWTPT